MTKIAVEYQNYQQSQLMNQLAAYAHEGEYRGQTSSATYSEIRSRIEAMDLLPGSHILDAGCGNGSFSLPLASHFPYFIKGIDLGERLIDTANKLALEADLGERAQFFTGDFANPLLYTELFNAVLCIGSLYWGQPLAIILDIWHRTTRPGGQLLLFSNLAYGTLSADEQEAIGETRFFPALTVAHELSQHGWALCEWSDATATYIAWLQRFCDKMEALSAELHLEMGTDRASKLIRRFTTYLTLAKKQAVRRIILRAEHV